MKKYFIYARKSSESEDRQILSIDSQIRELNNLTSKQNIKDIVVIQEAKSAKHTGRPGFTKLIEEIERGNETHLLVWHPDRISRNPQDSAKIVALMDSGKLFEVITPTQTFRNNPLDKFMIGLFMMQAKFENDHKSVNVKEGLQTKAEKGWLPSGAKFGYMNDKYAEKGNKTVLKDPERFPLIRKAWDLMLTNTYSVMEILRKLNDEMGYRTPKHKRLGGKPMKRSAIYKMFTDPFYYGQFEYPIGSGQWYTGAHEPMITKEEFDKVQILLGRKGRAKPQNHAFQYAGLLFCGECGATVTAEDKWQVICSCCKNKFASLNRDACPKCATPIADMANPKILHYIYYHCTKRKNPNCTQRSIQEHELEEQVDKILSNIEISERFKDWAIKHLNELNDKEVEDRNSVLNSLQKAYEDVVKRIDNLVKLKISPQNADNSLLSDDEFKDQKTALIKEKVHLEERMNDTGHRIERWMETAEKTFDFACHARYSFTNGDFQTKREIFAGLGSNLTLKDKIVRVELQKPLQYIEKAKVEVEEISPMFEPTKKGFTEAQMQDFYSQNPSLLPEPQILIPVDYAQTVQPMFNVGYFGEMKQRWEEIQRMQNARQTI